MSTGLLAQWHVRMFEYEAWCTPRVVESLRRADEHVKEVGLASLAGPLERALEVFGHVQAAKQVWLSRVSSLAEFPRDGVFPVWALERSGREAAEMDKLWMGFVRTLDDAALARVVRYTSTEGVERESALGDILSHVVNHGTYHRGQIAMLVAHTGTKPEPTDYIVRTRVGE